MDVPKNCRECRYAQSCLAPHYGGSKCNYENEITRALVEQMRCTKEET